MSDEDFWLEAGAHGYDYLPENNSPAAKPPAHGEAWAGNAKSVDSTSETVVRHARFATARIAKGKTKQLREVYYSQVKPMYGKLPGFCQAHLSIDEAAGKVVNMTEWESEAAALDATSQMSYRKAMHALAECFDGTPEITTSELHVVGSGPPHVDEAAVSSEGRDPDWTSRS